MIGNRLLSTWDALVGSAAIIAIILLAFSVMVNAEKGKEALRRGCALIGVAILLVMLPAIIASLWNAMSFGQHLGIATSLIALFLALLQIGTRRPGHRKDS